RAFAHDQQNGVLILGAVPMHLLGEMGDKAAGRHRRRVGGVEFRPRADPPRALQNDDVAVVGVEVRAAVMIAVGPLVVHHIEAGLSSAAEEMLSMPAKTSGVMRYRQDRIIAFTVSSVAAS